MKLFKPKSEASRELLYELISGGSGIALALFMFGHTALMASMLAGARGFDWVVAQFGRLHLDEPIVVLIFALFLVHAVYASRKIPAKLAERRKLKKLGMDLSRANGFEPHLDSLLWIWQVRTGMVILVLGSFHIILIGLDVFTPLFGDRVGLEAQSTLEREQAGLWLPYVVLTICVAFHTAVGLYRLAVKWGVGARLSRRALKVMEHIILWTLLGLGAATLIVMAGWISPPLAFLFGATP